jgi:hypothetical protein
VRFSSAQSSLQSNFQAISDLTTVLHRYYIGTTSVLHCIHVVLCGRVGLMAWVHATPTRPTPPGPTGRGPTREGGIGTETHLTWHCCIPYAYPRTNILELSDIPARV